MRTRVRWIILTGALLLTSFGLFWILRARQALDMAHGHFAEPPIAFQIRPLSDSKPIWVDSLPTPPDFRDGGLFNELLYICGSGGVWAYDLDGELQASYLVGRDLPPSPPVAMAVGTVAGDAAPKLWIGTVSAGLLVFDGTRFSQIELAKGTHGNITSLLMLPTGLLLVGLSEGGVLAYDGATLKPYHITLKNISVTALAGSEGDLWIGTRDRGVIHWQGGSTEEFHDQNGLPDKRVLSLAASDDRVFVGTSVGTAEFRDGKHARNIAEGVLSRSLLIAKDRLLIGTLDEGIVEVNLTTDRSSALSPASDLQPRSTSRLLDIRGIPVALTSDGLFDQELRSGLWTRRISAANQVWSDRNISALSIDALGRLWIGYFDRGIDIADRGGMQKATHIEDDQVFCINRIVPDPHRRLQVVATANGLVLFNLDGKIAKRIARADGLIADHVTDVAVRPDGLSVATSAGVTTLDAGGAESIYAFHGLVNNHVYTLGLSGSQLLAGTLGGLSLIQDGFVRTSYTSNNSPLKQNWISAVVSFNDRSFIGTYGGGVLQIDTEGNWTEFPDMPPNIVVNPNAMLALPDLVLAGTLDRGLLIYRPSSQRWTTLIDGLPSLNVTALTASSGTLFIGTDNGAVRLPIERVPQ